MKPAFSLLSALWSGDKPIPGRVSNGHRRLCFLQFEGCCGTYGLVPVVCEIIPWLWGMIYDLLLLKGRSFFSGQDLVVNEAEILTSWVTGTMFLNTWALMCYYGVFTWHFWIDVGAAALDAEVHAREHDGGQAPARDDGDVGLPDSTWQGPDGRLGELSYSRLGNIQV